MIIKNKLFKYWYKIPSLFYEDNTDIKNKLLKYWYKIPSLFYEDNTDIKNKLLKYWYKMRSLFYEDHNYNLDIKNTLLIDISSYFLNWMD